MADFEQYCFDHQMFKVKGDKEKVRDDAKTLLRYRMQKKVKKYNKKVHEEAQVYRYYSIKEERSMNIIKLPDWFKTTKVYLSDYHRSVK